MPLFKDEKIIQFAVVILFIILLAIANFSKINRVCLYIIAIILAISSILLLFIKHRESLNWDRIDLIVSGFKFIAILGIFVFSAWIIDIESYSIVLLLILAGFALIALHNFINEINQNKKD